MAFANNTNTRTFLIVATTFALIFLAAFGNCKINKEKETETSTATHDVYKYNIITDKKKGGNGLNNVGMANRKEDHPDAKIDSKKKVSKEDNMLPALVITLCVLVFLTLIFVISKGCYRMYTQREAANAQEHNAEVIIQSFPTGFVVAPGHIIWQPGTGPITYSSSATSAPVSNDDNKSQAVQGSLTAIRPETPPPAYQETANV